MKIFWPTVLSSSLLFTACGKKDHDNSVGGVISDPKIEHPVEENGLYVYDKVDHFTLPADVPWAYSFDQENPTFNMALYCKTNEGHCLNGFLDEGKVVLETAHAFKTSEAVEINLAIFYAGFAMKYAANDQEFADQSFFQARIAYKVKDKSGVWQSQSEEFMLPMHAIGNPQVSPWKNGEKSIYYWSGNPQNLYRVTARLPEGSEDIKVQLYNVGASSLQIQSIEIKATPV